ncbi:DMA protein, partial [Bucorvus abyssinicus]|nr:DMA protein [Bucorvus abyssinicus]
ARWTPQSPRLPPWPPSLEPPEPVAMDAALCRELLDGLSRLVAGRMPESKGIPVVDVFPAGAPPTPGEPTTLVCRVENVFPPDVEVTWRLDGVPVTRGVTHTHYTPTADLAFTRFSYLRAAPAAGQVVTCAVTRQGDNSSVVALW